MKMEIDKKKRYESSDDFFNFGGSALMKLSSDAAIASCLAAAKHGLIIIKVEGGIWHFPGFEARLDCIWDGINSPAMPQVVENNNLTAANFIFSEKENHDVFVLTASSAFG